MTLDEKIGQLSLVQSPGNMSNPDFITKLKLGVIGGILNEVNAETIRLYQEVAIKESRLGIPLIFSRDVIHGFKIIYPVNIGMAASFDEKLVERCFAAAAHEAMQSGIRWALAPMVDICRDPRWGRVAESFGEDPELTAAMGLAALHGFHLKNQFGTKTMATCAKHFVGYGAVEGGRDYNTVSIPWVDLENIYLKPFKSLVQNGVDAVMTSFTELNGIPMTANEKLVRYYLKNKLDFEGVVVSDWESISGLITHGVANNSEHAALLAFRAGIDMEMASMNYRDYLKSLLEKGEVSELQINEAVRRVLKMKKELGLFEHPFINPEITTQMLPDSHFQLAEQLCRESMVLLKNDSILPLSEKIKKVAVIGPMANDRYEQLGTWVFDGDTQLTVTPLQAIRSFLGNDRVVYAPGLLYSRDHDKKRFKKAIEAARQSEAIIFVGGEEAILTGEAHCRAKLQLPGAQNELIRELKKTGKPLILVIMTARPLTITEIMPYADAILYAWHPGTMGGKAISDLLFGKYSPAGKLPITFPVHPGQIPVYYNHKNTGSPPSEESWIKMEDIPIRAFQTSLGNTSHYLDLGYEPLFPFGYGLSYTTFTYQNLSLSHSKLNITDSLVVEFDLSNTGKYTATEVAQLYLRDWVGSITRPVRELKRWKRVRLNPGETRHIQFVLYPEDLSFYNAELEKIIEPGKFSVFVGSDSRATLQKDFIVEEDKKEP